jgi:hypothetical protein
MRRILFCAIFLCSAFGACADRRGTTTSNTSIAFEQAEADSGDASAADKKAEIAATSSYIAASANSATNASAITGGGGGGGRRSAGQIVKQNISLAQTSASAVDTAASDRKIIRNAELNLEATDPEAAQRTITGIAELKGGFVVESQQSSSDIKATSRDIVTMTVRVPAERFSETLDEIRTASTRVVTETVKGQDVTEEFIDIEAQLKAKKALEEQFMAIKKRANSVVDALDVQSQLADVRGEIERIEGRKRFLENQSSLSTIKIRLQTAKVFAQSSAGFGTRLTEAFGSGLDVAMNFVLGLITFVIAALPFAAFVGLPCFVIIRYVLRRQARPKSVTEIAEEEIKST